MIDSFEKLSEDFFLRSNVVQIARELVGKFLVTGFENTLTVGKIVETEAYDGRRDKACHAYHKKTPRTEVMYKSGGHVYVYLCYGIHHLFNIVTNEEGKADAVLIRALEPIEGLEKMKERRRLSKKAKVSSGPGTLSQAMGINISSNGDTLFGPKIYIVNNPSDHVETISDRRIGVDYAEEDALLPWRFFDKKSKYISKPKQKPLIRWS